jgi:hypothetical protein
MDIYQIVIANKELLKIIYALVISLICMIIVVKTDKFYKLSLHEGLRYFRNAFFFYGLAFLARYLFGVILPTIIYTIIFPIFEYLIVLAGFFLLYSLTWKKFNPTETGHSSLFNSHVIIFHAMSIIIAVLDTLFGTFNFMFYSQIILFFYALLIAYSNYSKNPKRKFLKFYFVAMLLELFIWILNLLTATLFSFNRLLLLNIGIINVIFFLLILYGVAKVTKK